MTDVLARRLEARELLGREAGAGGDEGLLVFDGQVERAQALLHAGHVDEHVAFVDDGREVVYHGDTQVAPKARNLAEVATDVVAPGRPHAAYQLHALALVHEPADGLTHLPMAPDDDHLHTALLPTVWQHCQQARCSFSQV